jgi:hypothetical protein
VGRIVAWAVDPTSASPQPRHNSCTPRVMRLSEDKTIRRMPAAFRAASRRLRVTATLLLAFGGLSGAPAAHAHPLLERLLQPPRATYGAHLVRDEVRHVADWVVGTRDHENLPFMIVDKHEATLYAFDRTGRLLAASPVLIGAAVGDRFEPGVEDMDMYHTRPWQRITPAGRFRADLYRTQTGDWSVWVDYDTGIALHKLVPMSRAQRRHDRIASPDARQRRITYGCINVPAAFFDRVVHPLMKESDAMVYVLPETRPAHALFASSAVARRVPLGEEFVLSALRGLRRGNLEEHHVRATLARASVPRMIPANGAQHP